MTEKIKFIKNKDDFEYNPKELIGTFYQFCQYKNPFTGKYSTRKIIFNEKYEIIKIFEKENSLKKINEYVKTHKLNKFKIYPTNSVDNIELPNGNDMMECFSELINGNRAENDDLFGTFQSDDNI